MRLRRDLRPCRPRLYVNVHLERVHGDVVGDADPLTYRRDSVGGTHDRHVTMKATLLTVSWMFESCVGHNLRLLGRHPRSQHTTSDELTINVWSDSPQDSGRSRRPAHIAQVLDLLAED